MDPFRCGYGPCGVGRGGVDRGWGWLGLVDSIALWLLLLAAILVVIALVRRAGGSRAAFSTPKGPVGAAPAGWASAAVPSHITQAEATLADRFARGEISAEQYQEQLGVLRGYQPPGTPAPPPTTPPPTTPPPGYDANP